VERPRACEKPGKSSTAHFPRGDHGLPTARVNGVTRLEVPTLIVVGDQDEPCLEPSLFMKRHIAHAGLVMLPMTGHTANIEEPALFNLHLSEFLAAVENGRWGTWSDEKAVGR